MLLASEMAELWQLVPKRTLHLSSNFYVLLYLQLKIQSNSVEAGGTGQLVHLTSLSLNCIITPALLVVLLLVPLSKKCTYPNKAAISGAKSQTFCMVVILD